MPHSQKGGCYLCNHLSLLLLLFYCSTICKESIDAECTNTTKAIIMYYLWWTKTALFAPPFCWFLNFWWVELSAGWWVIYYEITYNSSAVLLLLLLNAVGKLGFAMCICFAIADIVSQFGPLENFKLWKREGVLVPMLEKYETLL